MSVGILALALGAFVLLWRLSECWKSYYISRLAQLVSKFKASDQIKVLNKSDSQSLWSPLLLHLTLLEVAIDEKSMKHEKSCTMATNVVHDDRNVHKETKESVPNNKQHESQWTLPSRINASDSRYDRVHLV